MGWRKIVLIWCVISLVVLAAVTTINDRARQTSRTKLDEAIAYEASKVEITERLLSDQWQLLLGRVNSLHRLAGEVANAMPIWDPQGTIQGVLATAYRVRVLQDALELAGLDKFPQVALANAMGIAVWSTITIGLISVDVSDREHIRAVLREGRRSFIGRPVRGHVSGQMTIQFADPIHNSTGDLVGVSVVSVSTQSVRKTLTDMRLGPRDVIVILREDDVVIASTIDSLVGSELSAATVAELVSAKPGEAGLFQLHPSRLSLVRTFRPTGQDYWVVVLVDYQDAMATTLNLNAQQMRYSFVVKCVVVLAGIAVGIGCMLLGYILRLVRTRQSNELEMQVNRDFANAARVGPGVLYRVVFDQAGRPAVAMISDAVGRITGYSVSEVESPKCIVQAIDSDTRRSLRRAFHSCRAGQPQSLEFRLRRRDGKRIWVQNNMQPSIDSMGEFGIIGYLLDISLAKEQAHLMAQVGKLATLGEMATGIAHELRLPIATIALAADNLRHDINALPKDQASRMRQAVERIATQAARSVRLMEHMLVFGRSDDSSRGPVRVERAIAGAMLLMDYRIRASRIRMVIRIPPCLTCIVGHQVLLEQVLVNLVVNAIDAYDSGGSRDREIAISATALDHSVRICVADRAGGINGENPERVFEPFYSSKPPGQGTGLGLTFSRRVVQEMGGTITVESKGGGTVFVLVLPAFGTGA
jgi:PAS domain S-box-containing protein